jgi:hypothetical protein
MIRNIEDRCCSFRIAKILEDQKNLSTTLLYIFLNNVTNIHLPIAVSTLALPFVNLKALCHFSNWYFTELKDKVRIRRYLKFFLSPKMCSQFKKMDL